jgi:predicted amidohydrolase
MASETKPFRVACVQMRSGLDRARNTKDAIDFIKDAVRAGAKFVATPEMTNIVDRKGARLLSQLPEESELEEIAAFSAVAARLGIWLLVGSLALRSGEKAANRSFLFSPNGTIAARYDKLHMFDVELEGGESWKESQIYRAGDRAVVVKTPLAAFGLSICYDLRFPRLYRALSQFGAEILCAPSAFTLQTGRAHWKTLLTARAIENGAFVVAPAQGGTHEDGRETYGHSMIIGPWGGVLAEADNDEPGVILADVDPGAAHEVRRRIPNLALEQYFKISIVKQ